MPAQKEPPDGPRSTPVPFPGNLEQWPTGRLLSTASRLAKHAWNEQLRSAELTHAGFVAVDVLSATGTLTSTRLAQVIHIRAQTIGRIPRWLVSHGYVSRERDPARPQSLAGHGH